MPTWYNVDSPEAVNRFTTAWGSIDAPTDELGEFILEIAKLDVLSEAPVPETDEEAEGLEDNPPARYVFAQLQQAKNLWNAGRAQQDGQVGTETYSFVPRPMDKTIRRLIRPQRGTPDVF